MVVDELGRPVSTDAVVVVPGIMGSELVDADGRVCWGLKPALLARAWLTGSLNVLRVTGEDAAGGGRLRPSRLLRVPGYMPLLGGLEPYTYLLDRLSQAVADRRALAEFPYDWRLSIAHNASLLVSRCEQHLEAWRTVVRDRRLGDPADVRLVVVAHSMGGLVTRYAAAQLGLGLVLRQVITLGTPFYGAVKAVQMMATGEGVEVLPRRAARGLAVSCPGVYDLLPRYRCLDTDAGLVRVEPAHLADLGGDQVLAGEAAARWAQLGVGEASPGGFVEHAVVGTEQPTLQSWSLSSGRAVFTEALAGVDHGGDSTVYRQAAAAGGVALPLPQRHGALAKSPEAAAMVIDKLVGADAKPPLGTRQLGADIPNLLTVGRPATVRVRVADGSPIGVTVTSTALDTGAPTDWGIGLAAEDDLVFTRPGLAAGLHRVQVKAGGYSGVTDIMLVEPAP